MPLYPKQEPPYYTESPSGNGGVKQYIALLSQTGTNNPTGTPIINTIGTVTITRTGEGNYLITSTGNLTLYKTIITFQNTNAGGDNIVVLDNEDGDTFQFRTYKYDTIGTQFTVADGLMYLTPIQITVYP